MYENVKEKQKEIKKLINKSNSSSPVQVRTTSTKLNSPNGTPSAKLSMTVESNDGNNNAPNKNTDIVLIEVRSIQNPAASESSSNDNISIGRSERTSLHEKSSVVLDNASPRCDQATPETGFKTYSDETANLSLSANKRQKTMAFVSEGCDNDNTEPSPYKPMHSVASEYLRKSDLTQGPVLERSPNRSEYKMKDSQDFPSNFPDIRWKANVSTQSAGALLSNSFDSTHVNNGIVQTPHEGDKVGAEPYANLAEDVRLSNELATKYNKNVLKRSPDIGEPQTNTDDALAAARKPLTDLYGPFLCPKTDTCLADGRRRLKNSLIQTRRLRKAFTDRVYTKYRVCLRKAPEAEKTIADILDDPVGMDQILNRKILQLREEKDIEKKEAAKLNTEMSQSKEIIATLANVENAEQLMYFTAGLNLVILPDEEIDAEEVKGYSERGPINPVTGGRVRSITQASATAGEVIIERTRKSAAMREERLRRQLNTVQLTGEIETGYSRLDILVSSEAKVPKSTTATFPNPTSIIKSDSEVFSSKELFATPLSIVGANTVKPPQYYHPAWSLSTSTVMSLNPVNDDLSNIASKKSPSSDWLIAHSSGLLANKSSFQRIRNPPPAHALNSKSESSRDDGKAKKVSCYLSKETVPSMYYMLPSQKPSQRGAKVKSPSKLPSVANPIQPARNNARDSIAAVIEAFTETDSTDKPLSIRTTSRVGMIRKIRNTSSTALFSYANGNGQSFHPTNKASSSDSKKKTALSLEFTFSVLHALGLVSATDSKTSTESLTVLKSDTSLLLSDHLAKLKQKVDNTDHRLTGFVCRPENTAEVDDETGKTNLDPISSRGSNAMCLDNPQPLQPEIPNVSLTGNARLNFYYPRESTILSQDHLSLIRVGKIHELIPQVNDPTYLLSASEYLIAVGAAVPIPKALVSVPLKDKLSASSCQRNPTLSLSLLIPRDVVIAVINIWLWSKHERCFQRAFVNHGRIDVDRDCKWLIQAAVQMSTRAILFEINESLACGTGAFAELVSSRKGAPIPRMQTGQWQMTFQKRVELCTASVVSKALVDDLYFNDSVDFALPNFLDAVKAMDDARLKAFRLKSQERTLLACLLSRRTNLEEVFANAYVSSMVRAGEALGHGELFETVQNEETMTSTMIPYDIFTDYDGSWEDPSRTSDGFTPGLTGDEMIYRAHARALIHLSLRKLQDRHNIRGGTPSYGPYQDISNNQNVHSGMAKNNQSSGPSPRPGLKRKISKLLDAPTQSGIIGANAKNLVDFDLKHISSALEWDSWSLPHSPYGTHSNSFRNSRSGDSRANKVVKRDMSESSSLLVEKGMSNLMRSTHEIDWADVASGFDHVKLLKKVTESKNLDVTSTRPSERIIYAPFFRRFTDDPKMDAVDESDSEEDLRDESMLERHQVILDKMKAHLHEFQVERKKHLELRKSRISK